MMENTGHKGQPNELLRRERLLHGWSFRDVADHISCPDERLVRRWESGAVFPSTAYRQKLCQLFEKNAEELGLLRVPSVSSPAKGPQELAQQPPEHLSQGQEKGDEHTQPVLQKTQKDMNRLRMLERVRHIWVKGVLEHTRDMSPMIPLNLYEDAQIVENPWRLDIQEVNIPARTLTSDIGQVYDTSHGELLILGEAGAGKTTLLLSLADTLLERAADDDMVPIPVIFHLTSWSIKKQPLVLWLIEELIGKYQVPPHISQTWVEQDRLLLLLDGLDEVDTDAYESCIEAINTYREDHGLVSLVICSRYAEYFAQSRRLLLKNAIVVQPLTLQQVDLYLEQELEPEALAELRMHFAREIELQELVKTPLMLTILISTYKSKPTDSLFTQEGHTQRDQLLHAYVQRMFQRRTPKQPYTKEQTFSGLSWLARHMKQHRQEAFYIESLQFDCFSEGSRLQHVPILLFGLMMALFGWLSYGLFFGVNLGLRDGLLQGGFLALCLLLAYLFINGFVFERIKWLNESTSVRPYSFWENRSRWPSLIKRSCGLLIYGLSFGLPFGLLFGWITERIYGLPIGIAYGVYNMLILTIDFMLLGRCPKTIQPVEVLIYSWGNLRKRLVYCIGGSLAIGIVLWLFFINEFEVMHALVLALILSGGFFCLLAVSVGMVSPHTIDTQFHQRPNEGISRSGRNSLALGGWSGGLAGLFFALIFLLFGRPSVDLAASSKSLIMYGILPGISAFQIIGLRNGGYAWIQHFVLRFFLWRAGTLPWNYTAFLDYAVERVFLQKVGGGYIFIHSLLLDYFAHLHRR